MRADFKAFSDEILGYATDGLDAADIQALAIKHELVKEITATKLCHAEWCTCGEVGFPTQCMRKNY